MKAREMTPHEQRIASMTTRERLIFRLIRRIAHLLGRGKEFDANCDRIASLSTEELHEDTKRKLDELRSKV